MADREEIDRKLSTMAFGSTIVLVSQTGARYRGVRQELREGVDGPDDVVIRRARQIVAMRRDQLKDVEFA